MTATLAHPAAPVLVLGGASWNTMVYLDEFPAPQPATLANARSHIAAGSTGIGKAMALKALGHDVLLHAALGDDEAGQHLRAHCRRHDLPAVFDLDPGGSSRHVNLMDRHGRRISIFLCNGSPQPPIDADRWSGPIAQAGTIFLNITASSVPLLPLVAASGAEVWVDLHDYDGSNPWHAPFIAQADVLQFSDEAVPDPRALMQRLIGPARLVVCTRAGRGVLALDAAGQWHEVPACPATLRDSNGAGDVFGVALWHALQAGQALPEALRFAAAAGALTVESLSIVPDDLTPARVVQRLAAWPDPQRVLDFWFGPPSDPEHGRARPQWFRKDATFDAKIAARFGPLIDAALSGGLQDWAATPAGALALILVLDQFTRNTGRDTPRAFAGDTRALALARALVACGADRTLTGVQRQFVYLPFEHAESLADQDESVRLFAQLGRDEPALAGLLEWAERHRVIVARFGRFPHRNAALGRAGTGEEIEFLRQPGAGF